MKTADLSIKLVADIADVQRKMAEAQRSVSTSMQSIAKAATVARLALAGIAGGISLQAITGLADAFTNLQSRLKTVTTSQQELATVQGKLFEIANRTRSSVEETVNLYAQLARSTKETKLSQEQLLTVVESFNKAVIVSGGSTESAKAAITQFNQAMASGVLRGEEFNSVSEQAPRILDMLAQSLGKTRGELREMAKEGKLTSDVVLLGILESTGQVNAEFAKMGLTVGGATTILKNNLIAAVGDLDKATGASAALAAAISGLAGSLKTATDFIVRNKEELKAWAGAIAAVGLLALLPAIAAGFTALTTAVTASTAALLANPLAWAAVAAGGLAYLGIKMYEKITEEKKATEELNESLAETQRLQRQNDSAAQGAAKAALAAAEAKAKQAKAAEDLKKAYDKLVQSIRTDIVTANAQAQASQNGFNKAQEDFIKLVGSPEWKNYSAAQRRTIADLYEQKIAAEAAAEAAKKAAIDTEKMMSGFDSLRSKIRGEDSGLDSDFLENIESIRFAFEKGRVSLEEYVSLVEKYITQQKFYVDQQKAAAEVLKEYAEANDEFAKKLGEEEKKRREAVKSAQEMVEQIRFENEALKMTNDEREIAIKLRELENKGIAQGTEEYTKFAEQIREAVTAKEATEASIKQQQEYVKQFEKISDQIGQGLTNALIQGGKSASEYIKNLFRTMVLRPLLEPIIRGGVGAIMGTLGMGAPGTAAAAGGAGGGAVNVLTVLNNGYNVIKDGFSSMTGQLGTQIRDVADFFIQSSNQTISQFGQALYRGSESLASAAGTLGNAAAAYGIQKFLSGGYKVGNGVIVDVLTAVGGAFFGPIAGVVGAVVNRAFGRKLTQAGIMGNFGGDAGFAGSNYKFEKGGWFRSDKTSTSPLDPAVQNALAQQFLAIQGSMQAMAGALGGVADSVDNYTKAIKVNLKGLSQEKAQAKLQQVFEGITEELALIVLRDIGLAELQAQGVDTNITRLVKKKPVTSVNTALLDEYVADFARVGETSAQTLQRLSGAISVVNQAFDSLGYSMMQASLAGADMASKLTEAFGGVENFTKAIDAYYGAFYTEAERTATLTRQLTETFANMGLTLPATREAYRALVEAQDLTTEAGRNLFAALVQLSPTFASVVTDAQAVTDAVDDLGAAMRSAADIASERVGLERELLTLQGDTAALAALDRAAIDPSNVDLFDQIQTIKAQQAADAKSLADAADRQREVQAVQSERLSLETRLLQLEGNTSEIRRRELLALDPSNQALQQRIWKLEDEKDLLEAQQRIADERLGLERQILELSGDTAALLKLERDALDPSNRALFDRIQVLKAEKEATEKAAAAQEQYVSALSNAAESLVDEIARLRGVNRGSTASLEADFALATAAARAGDATAAGKLAGISKALSDSLSGTASSSLEIVRANARLAVSLQETLVALGGYGAAMPSGAAVAATASGASALPAPPAMYSGSSTLATDSAASEIRALREEQRAQSSALVGLQNRMTKMIEKWDGDGLPETRSVAS